MSDEMQFEILQNEVLTLREFVRQREKIDRDIATARQQEWRTMGRLTEYAQRLVHVNQMYVTAEQRTAEFLNLVAQQIGTTHPSLADQCEELAEQLLYVVNGEEEVAAA